MRVRRFLNLRALFYFIRTAELTEKEMNHMPHNFKRAGENTISKSLEDYLEAIYVLSKDNAKVRITDVARYLKISKPSANRAVNSLKAHGYAEHEPYGDIFLTEFGQAYADDLYRRHTLIKKLLINVIGVSESAADTEACMIEHSISNDTLAKIEKFITSFQ